MLLEIKNIKKQFQTKTGAFGEKKNIVKAVNNVSLSIREGENISIVGESGCGKTTLARVIMDLLPFDHGHIAFMGKDVEFGKRKEKKEFRKNIQMVFQDPYSSLDPRFTVGSIIKEGMILDRKSYRTEKVKNERVKELLESVGLSGNIINRFPHEFSGGERQRIAIARALVLNPKLLILDEAVSSLDVIIQKQIIDLLVDLKSKFNLTYIFISHNLNVVRKVCQRTAVMYKGKIVEMANTEDIFNYPMHEYTKELLSAAVDYKTLKATKPIEIKEDARLINRGGDHFVLED